LPNYKYGFGVGKREGEIEKIGRRNASKSPDPGRYYSGIQDGEKLVNDKHIITGYRKNRSV
jgi:hypothetical protein